jgi:hypothetical protein
MDLHINPCAPYHFHSFPAFETNLKMLRVAAVRISRSNGAIRVFQADKKFFSVVRAEMHV